MDDFSGIGTCDNCGALLLKKDLLSGLCGPCGRHRGGIEPIKQRGRFDD